MLPDIVSHLLHGEPPPQQPEHLRLKDLATIPPDKGGWVLLGLREQDESRSVSSADSGGR